MVVGTTSIGGMTYWYASGLSGSGGEGEGTGGDPVPFFPWWGLPALALICGTYVMRRETALE